MIVFPFLTGLAYTWGVAVAAALCSGFLAGQAIRHRNVCLYINAYSGALILILLSGLITIFADMAHGDAFIGFFRLLTCVLYAVVAMNVSDSCKKWMVRSIPISGTIMVCISAVMYLTPLRSVVFEGSRLAGFFQYSNTMALFLLIGIILMLHEKPALLMEISLLILLIGLLWTGSRLTYLLAVISLVILLIRKQADRRTVAVLVLMVAIPVVAAFFSDVSFGRIFSRSSSTIIGRLLYWKDALPVLLKHPLGLGYRGYYHIESRIAHGVYSVKNVHNDYLQMGLDYGWLALVAFAYLIIRAVRDLNGKNRLIVIMMAVHFFFEFDLEFLVIWFCLITLLPLDHGTERNINAAGTIIASSGVMALSVWLFAGSIAWAAGSYMTAQRIIPFSSLTIEDAMMNSESSGYAERMARSLLKMYPEDPAAAGTLSDVYYMKIQSSDYEDIDTMRHDIGRMMSYKWMSVRNAPYGIDSVRELRSMIAEVGDSGDDELESLAHKYDGQLEQLMRATEEKTDRLAYMINDKPVFK